MRMRMGLFGAVLSCLGFSSPSVAHAQNVLLFDGGTNHYALQACMGLSLTCSVVLPGEDLATMLAGASWDLVVLDLPSSEPAAGWTTAVSAYVAGGGAAIHSEWLSTDPTLEASFQVALGSGHDAIPFYQWGTSPLYDAPETVPDDFTMIVDLWGTNGFFLTPVGTAYAAAGFDMVPGSGRAAIVIGNSDRTIFNGFLFDDYVGDVDGDTLPDMVELLTNEIAFVLGMGSAMGPCVGIPEAGACTTPRGGGTCRAGRCCTGCWDGMACRGGSTSTACGVMGLACTSCDDAVVCTSDVCTAGACTHPPAPATTPCDDGLFCTLTDRCSGTAATCTGSGPACDDRASCTVDTCDEASDRCTFTMTAGCIIGGVCVGDGTLNASYPCLICDTARSTTDWSPRMAGTMCSAPFCGGGRLTGAGSCDAAGTCVRPASTRCPAGCADAMTCADTCDVTGCATTEFCGSTGMCMPLLPTGTTCTSADMCLSGFCVDGVCCGAACTGTCQACNGAPRGTCAPVARGADPANECALACDGAGACMMAADAGTDAAMPDAGAPDAGRDAGTVGTDAGFDAGGPVRMGRGCACRATSATSPAAGAWGLALFVLALVGRRRRG